MGRSSCERGLRPMYIADLGQQYHMSVPHRWWMLTLNNPGVVGIESLHKQLCSDFSQGQLEIGENGTLHIQAIFWFRGKKRFGGLKKLVPEGHWEPVQNVEASLKYVVKESTRHEGPWTFGELPVKRNSKEDWEEVLNLAKSGKIDQIPAQIVVQHYSNLKKIQKDYLRTDINAESVRGVWVHGLPGCGKTHLVRENFNPIYLKNNNKWWDGYQDQPYVVLEDVDSSHWKFLVNNMKIWADKFSFIGESKCGAVAPTYKRLFVTSNYTIDQLFESLEAEDKDRKVDRELRAAVSRRFEEWEMTKYVDGTRLLDNGDIKLTVDEWVARYR